MKHLGKAEKTSALLSLSDLSGLSIASVAPLFSLAAAGTILLRLAGSDVIWAVLAIAVPFILSSWLFRMLNQHYPNTGASYHWSRRVLGFGLSRFQAWVLMMAYFWSIPPIIIPAAEESLSLLRIPYQTPWAVILTSGFWIVLSIAILLRGSKATARLTTVFMGLELMAVVTFSLLGLDHWHHMGGHLPIPSWHSFVIAMVIGATMVDGWEIDSYAAEEAAHPRKTPGLGGIIGALMVVVFYVAMFPLLLHSMPFGKLTRYPDVLTTWAGTLYPSGQWLSLLPILASTAGSLWLTTFILSKALYAMARDRMLPRFLTFQNKKQVAVWAIMLPMIVGWAVVAMQLMWQSLNTVFGLVLGAAGFFLILEFLFDSLSAAVFLTRIHQHGLHGMDHRHRGLQGIAYLTTAWFLATMGVFLVYGPSAIGGPVDTVIAMMVLGGILFLISGLKDRQRVYHVFDPDTRQVVEQPSGE